MYTEDIQQSSEYRQQYLDSIQRLIARQQLAADRARQEYLSPEQLAADPERYRRDLAHLLGWPLTEPRPMCRPSVREIPVVVTAEATITRLQIEVLPDFWYYGLLFVPQSPRDRNQSVRMPLVICQHGGYGTPELCSDMHGPNNYGGIVWRLIARGAVVFAPQMLLWREAGEDAERHRGYGLVHNRGKIDALLKQLGSSITALEVYSLSRSLDFLAGYSFVDPDRIGMTGLSYGGFYTLMTAAMDTRIRAGYASAFFNNRYRYCSGDWSWDQAARCFLDAEMAALIAPRALYIEVGKQDEVFAVESALPEFERLKPFYAARHASDKLRLNVIEQNHRFDPGDAGLDFLFEQLNERSADICQGGR